MRVFYLMIALTSMFINSALAEVLKPDPIHITANSLQVDQNTATATFKGDSVAKQKDTTLYSDNLVVYYKNPETGKNQVSHVKALGNVKLTHQDDTATGDKGDYDVNKNILTLSGNVKIMNGKNSVAGTNLVYNLKTGQSTIKGNTAKKGRVTGVFMPE